ncbi:hypothetical protein AMTR_s00047p00073050 [Amborella trichopoda]|uniref:Uncharacterized protein n=1 Tax=Amborella trichopoda TaxID=13333 RepID=U5D669_AMBTC|nr:hypothetical protein AMTR_s00047p00073050 [Amborella trichopoda]
MNVLKVRASSHLKCSYRGTPTALCWGPLRTLLGRLSVTYHLGPSVGALEPLRKECPQILMGFNRNFQNKGGYCRSIVGLMEEFEGVFAFDVH